MLNKVLLIDDSMVDRYIAERVITKNGIADSIISLDSAQLGLTFLLAMQDRLMELPEIILLDIHMPGMNGFEFLQEFEGFQDGVKKRCNIFLVTSSINASDQAFADGCQYVKGYINKPLNADKLNDALAKLRA